MIELSSSLSSFSIIEKNTLVWKKGTQKIIDEIHHYQCKYGGCAIHQTSKKCNEAIMSRVLDIGLQKISCQHCNINALS